MAGKTQAQPPAAPDDRSELRTLHPDSWIPLQPSDEIIGKVTDVQEAWSDQRGGGTFYPLLIVQVETATGYEVPADGLELKIHAFGSVMFNEVMRRQPEVGERIRVTYTGDRQPSAENLAKGHSPTRLFKLDVAGRKDAGVRAYASIRSSQQPQRGQAPGAPAPTTPADFQVSGPDEDIPF